MLKLTIEVEDAKAAEELARVIESGAKTIGFPAFDTASHAIKEISKCVQVAEGGDKPA